MNTNENIVIKEKEILRFVIAAEVTDEEGQRLYQSCISCLDSSANANGLVLIDTSNADEFSLEARKLWIDCLNHPNIKKAAIFGGKIFVRTLVEDIVNSLGKDSVRAFKTEEEALNWLRAD
ncbi:MAG: STAS/SEC14 domain-containing protein [bacterium]